jgi:orotate phosphoribosyltransferase
VTNEELIHLFEESGALLTGHFKLTSGRHSDVYYEKFTLLKQPTMCTRICEEMASRFKKQNIETVVGPTTGGIIIAYDVARYLGAEALYAEAGDNGRLFKRGFSLDKGQRVLIVDDVLTTGRSVQEVIDLVVSYQAAIVGLGVMLDRSDGSATFDYPLTALATVSAKSWDPSNCPLCQKGIDITQRGSRAFA